MLDDQMLKFALLSLFILCLVILMGMFYQKTKNIEENFAADTSEQRDCNTYFVKTPYVNACDKGYFGDSLTRLGYLYKKLSEKKDRTPSEEQDYADMTKAIALRAKNNDPGPIRCKLSWPDMVQNINPEKDPVKNDAEELTKTRNGYLPNGELKTTSEDWAFCYSASPTREDAQAEKANFGDKGAVIADSILSGALSPFGTDQVWLRYKFKNLQYDPQLAAFCGLKLRTEDRLPNNFPDLIIGVSVNTDMKITDIGVYLTRDDSSIYRYEYPINVFRKMLSVYYNAQKEGIMCIEKPVSTAYIKVLDFNPCGKVKVKANYGTSYPNGIFGIGEKLIMPVSDRSYFTNGTSVNALSTLLTQLQNDLVTIDNTITTLQATNNTSSYSQGIQGKYYKIDFAIHYANGRFDYNKSPPVANTADMNALFNNNLQYVSSYVAPYPALSSFGSHQAVELSGYIYIKDTVSLPVGYYQFFLNSDDASDMTVNDQLVSTYYGIHGADNRSTTICPNGDCNQGWNLTEGYHPFKIRVMNWHGNSGLAVAIRYKQTPTLPWSSWSIQNGQKSFAYFRDGIKINNDSLIAVQKHNKEQKQRQIGEIEKMIALFLTIPKDDVRSMMQNAIGTKLPNDAKKYISNDDKIYFDINLKQSDIPIPT